MAPDCPWLSMKSTQSKPLQVLMVRGLELPLHMRMGTHTPADVSVALAMRPHQSTYAMSSPCSSFSTCTMTMGPPCAAKNGRATSTTRWNQPCMAACQGPSELRRRMPGFRPSHTGTPPYVHSAQTYGPMRRLTKLGMRAGVRGV